MQILHELIYSVVARKKVGEYILPPYFFLASTPLFAGNYFLQKNLGTVNEEYNDTLIECKSELGISVGYPGICFSNWAISLIVKMALYR